MKDGAPGMFPHYLQYASDNFSVISGTIDSLLPAMMIGAVGGVVSLANPFPEACCMLYKLFKEWGTFPGKGSLSPLTEPKPIAFWDLCCRWCESGNGTQWLFWWRPTFAFIALEPSPETELNSCGGRIRSSLTFRSLGFVILASSWN